MKTSKEIRDLLGISRAEFSRKYGIPIRTLENWDSGTRKAPEWILVLLERIAKEDKIMDNKPFTKENLMQSGLSEDDADKVVDFVENIIKSGELEKYYKTEREKKENCDES